MSTFKSKMCGGTLEIEPNATIATCEYCGTQQTLPKLDDERRANLYDRANHFRRNNEFDKAMGIYEQILAEDNTDAEAYWSLVLCRYGIEYVDDPATGKKIPTCHRSSFDSVMEDSDFEQALENAGRALKETGCQAVKLEGGASVCPQIAALSHAGIPVVAHIGLTPQSVNALGGNRVQGKTGEAAERLIEDARKVEAAGAFAVVLECIPAPVAERISREVNIPTIGIGAGAGCDGQILVYQDMLGMNEDFKPKFVKRYANLAEEMCSAFREYTADVKGGRFPEASHQFEMSSEEELKKLY